MSLYWEVGSKLCEIEFTWGPSTLDTRTSNGVDNGSVHELILCWRSRTCVVGSSSMRNLALVPGFILVILG